MNALVDAVAILSANRLLSELVVGELLRVSETPMEHPHTLSEPANANVSVPSGPLSLRNGLLIFGIVCLVTLLIFLHSLH